MGAPTAALRRLAESAIDFALPRVCVSCDRGVERGSRALVCGRCWSALPRLAHPQCRRCGHPFIIGDVPPPASREPRRCRWCALLPPYVRAARSVCWAPESVAGPVLHALKYDGWSAVAPSLARRIAALDWPADVTSERAAVVPVPLAAERLRERGYNQSALIAASLAAAWQVPLVVSALARTRATASQTRLTPGERLRNVAGAFRPGDAVAAGALRGSHVVLVDDVVTTAATLNACAAALVAAGVRVVSYATFGRARC